MGTIETFDHTADVGLRIRGDDLDDRVEALESLSLEAETTLDLLVAWLNELIFRSETGHRLYSHFNVRVAADGLNLRAEIGGESIDHDRHILDHEVKAVTHHGLSLDREGQGWLAELILDI